MTLRNAGLISCLQSYVINCQGAKRNCTDFSMLCKALILLVINHKLFGSNMEGAAAASISKRTPSNTLPDQVEAEAMPQSNVNTSRQAKHNSAAEDSSSSNASTLDYSYGCPYCDPKRKIRTCKGWKQHMKDHDIEYPCRRCAGSGRSWKRKSGLVGHLQKAHNIHNGGPLAEEWRVSSERKYFGCGFCISLFDRHINQLNHIDVEHFRQSKDMEEWDVNNVVRGLIQQPGIQLAWENIPQGPTFAPQNLIWPPSVAKDLQLKLSLSKKSAGELAEEVERQATWTPSPPGYDENGSAAVLSHENLETHRTLQDIQGNSSVESATPIAPEISITLLKPSDNRISGISSDSFSDVGSVLSVVDSVASSRTSVALDDFTNLATEELIILLLQNAELNILYKAALADPRVGPERFERNFRCILNQYSVDLKVESRGSDQSTAYKRVRHRSRYVANVLRRIFEGQIESDHRHQVVEDKSPPHLVEEEAAAENDNPDDYRESTNAENLPEHSRVKDFMITSEAFLTLRASFWQLVDPSLKLRLNGLTAELEKVPPGLITVSYQSDVDQPSETPANGEANYLGSISIRVLLYAQNPLTGTMARFDFGGSEVGPFMKSMWKTIDGLSNRFKATVEDFTRCPWDWWPLKPRTRGIQTGYARICWRCVSNNSHHSGLSDKCSRVMRSVPKTFLFTMQKRSLGLCQGLVSLDPDRMPLKGLLNPKRRLKVVLRHPLRSPLLRKGVITWLRLPNEILLTIAQKQQVTTVP